MKRAVHIVGDNIYSPLGKTTGENFHCLRAGSSGIRKHTDPQVAANDFCAALFNADQVEDFSNHLFTRFESLLIASISAALENSDVELSDPKTLLVISSTKGNIALLESSKDGQPPAEAISMAASASKIAAHLNYHSAPIVMSNACISGLTAMLTAKRLIETGQYDHAVVAGADLISKFVLSGFQSFQAISAEPCKPFDANRNGITLGEAAGTIILSSSPGTKQTVRFAGGAVSNDANHISGPSRTGEELSIAINKTLKEAELDPKDIGFISAHGTATLYNDEMEAKAITLSHLESVPVNSLKGFYGHTLGAAGIIESVILVESLRQNTFIPTLGYSSSGVSRPININDRLLNMDIQHCIKTASGFGGCNAALAFSKEPILTN